MAKDVLLVELYAGLASLSLWCVGGRPPFGRQGSKQGYAAQIAGLLFGDRKPTRFLLNDADAGVTNALRVLVDPRQRAECAARLNEADTRRALDLWPEWRATSFPGDPPREAARWIAVSIGSAFGRYGNTGSKLHLSKVSIGGPGKRFETNFSPRLATVAALLDSFPLNSSFCEVRHGPAETVEPIPGSIAYLDPPYVSTADYSAAMLLPAKSVAERWRSAGCVVGLSEMSAGAAPLGWTPHVLAYSGARGRSRTIRGANRELLFVSP